MFFYCKMCGGELEVNQDATVGQCQYCGTKQTIPKTDNEKIMNLFNRANHYRMKNDFDNAMNSYENILNEDSKNAEAYWGLCLCRYGIEYVKDPLTEKMIPTCHRTQLESIIEDEDFISACENADSVARSTYEQEAKHIDKIQKKILQISSKEEDYDVFICYKEADNMGERTPDSVIGQDIYDALTEKGIRVFFARISLEDKVGTAYEPYIFAALQSAPIMITIGTKPEYMEAVWVKNEWSRFLAMMKKDSKKTIIPVYKFMNPYDMPEGFARIQAVNMEKIGAMQDLVHGIEKILGKDKNRIVEKVVRVDENANSASKYAPLLERAWIFLEDKNWNKAREYVERVLDMNPKCGEAYLIKMLAGMSLNNRNALKNWSHPLDGYDEYKKIMKYGDDELKNELMQYNKIIVDRQRKKEQELNEKRMREERELYERKKREEEERKARLEKKRQEIYAKYDDTIQSNRKKAQDLENEKHEIVEKIIALNANKIQISDRKKELEKQYNEVAGIYNSAMKKIETKKDRREGVGDIISLGIWGITALAGLVLGIAVPVIYFPNNSSGIAVISFLLLSLIVGVVGGFLLSMRFGDIKFFFGDYSQAKEKVKKKYPVVVEYQNICEEEENITKEIDDLKKSEQQYNTNIKGYLQAVTSAQNSIKKQIAALK
ncbi:TIR domain-containing protein [Clostridium sp. AF37-5]|nr:TIR domain-containing protein [Clostridium sp. AF37-5]